MFAVSLASYAHQAHQSASCAHIVSTSPNDTSAMVVRCMPNVTNAVCAKCDCGMYRKLTCKRLELKANAVSMDLLPLFRNKSSFICEPNKSTRWKVMDTVRLFLIPLIDGYEKSTTGYHNPVYLFANRTRG